MKVAFIASLLLVATIAMSSHGHEPNELCTELKHFDFFGLNDIKPSWSESDLDALFKQAKETRSPEKTNFLIPPLVRQIAEYDPKCSKRQDIERFSKLTSLYLLIRGYETTAFSHLPIEKQIDFVRTDYYQQVDNDKLLFYMLAGFDDGPLEGEITTEFPTEKLKNTAKTEFGHISFAQTEEKLFVAAFDANNKLLWSRILKGAVPAGYLSRIGIGSVDVKAYEAAIVIEVFVEGERLRIYVRPNGRFIFYTHSW